jgi:nucleoside-diphosphate-sugar epimerase
MCNDGGQTRDFVCVTDSRPGANVEAMQSDAIGGFNGASRIQVSVNEPATILGRICPPSPQPLHVPDLSGKAKYSVSDISRARR